MKITDRHLLIITDGGNVIDYEHAIPITLAGGEVMEEVFNKQYLQPILAVF